MKVAIGFNVFTDVDGYGSHRDGAHRCERCFSANSRGRSYATLLFLRPERNPQRDGRESDTLRTE